MQVLDHSVEVETLEFLRVIEVLIRGIGKRGALMQNLQVQLIRPPVRIPRASCHGVLESSTVEWALGFRRHDMLLLIGGGIAYSRGELFLHIFLFLIDESKNVLRARRSALRAEPAENEFVFAKNPLPEGARGGPRHVVPIDILDIPAAVADEMVMLHAFGIESRGAALGGHFAHQTRMH